MARKKPPVPPRPAERVRSLARRIRAADCSALLVSNPVDIRYLTGFSGEDSWAVVPARGGVVTVLSDFRFEEQIEREAPHVSLVSRKKSLADELASLFDRRRFDRIALQREHLTVGQRRRVAARLGARRLRDIDDGLLGQRAVKDPDEVRSIRRAVAIQQEAFGLTLERLEPGMTESGVAARLEFEMRSLGADGVSFPTIVAADANAALPHAVPGRSRLRRGGIVLFDFGARYRGYCSDLTRVVALGRMKPRLREIYQVVLDAQMAAIDAIAPGRRLADIDAVARKVIDRAGYGDRFGHGLGHGIGLDIHELPVLSGRATGELEPGHVVTVEPGIYLPGVGGVRIEDDVLLTARGHRVLSDLPKTLASAILQV